MNKAFEVVHPRRQPGAMAVNRGKREGEFRYQEAQREGMKENELFEKVSILMTR